MLGSLLVLALVPQQPVLTAATPEAPVRATVAVEGAPELSPMEAVASARERAVDGLRRRWEERARDLAEDARPFWMPGFFADRAVRRWLADLEPSRGLVVHDRRDEHRLHGWGESWQTTLVVSEDDRYRQRAERTLRWRLRGAEERLLWTGGGTIAFWGLLTLVLGWLDRLSRGYMSGRLTLLGVGLGTVVPAIAFLV